MKIEELKESLKQMKDPRRTTKGNILHKLEDIIIIGLCSLICNGSDFVDMEEFGEARQERLKQFLELPNGILDSDTFRRVAVPELLELVDVKGSIVTADAMSWEIVQKIQEKKTDYVIALKGNQPTLLEDATLYFETFGSTLSMNRTLEKDHGRIEMLEYRLATDLSRLPERKGVGRTKVYWHGENQAILSSARNDGGSILSDILDGYREVCVCGSQALVD